MTLIPSRLVLALAALLAAPALAVAGDPSLPESPDISAMIKAGLPVFSMPTDAATPTGRLAPLPSKSPAEVTPGVVRMSPYVMRDQRPFTSESVLTDKGLALEAMDRYLGSVDSLNRGFLNAYTLPQLWSKIPVLGRLPFAGPAGTLTNEERAMRLYRADKREEILQEFTDFVKLEKQEITGATK